LVTDHAPHTLRDKRVEGACGVPGLDNYGNIVSWLIKSEGVSPSTIASVCSGNQARFFRLRDRGTISKGKRADLTLLDLKSTERVSSADVRSKCGWTPYEGIEFPGRVRWTICRGRPLVDDYEYVA
jgi:dihydroorotase